MNRYRKPLPKYVQRARSERRDATAYCIEHRCPVPCRLCGTGVEHTEKWLGRMSADYAKIESK